MTDPPSSADAADAVAVAYCHAGHTLTAGNRRYAVAQEPKEGCR